jgi:hypothetical protein
MTPKQLEEFRRELISTLKKVEDGLNLPAEKRALKTRVDRGRQNKVRYTQRTEE